MRGTILSQSPINSIPVTLPILTNVADLNFNDIALMIFHIAFSFILKVFPVKDALF